MTATLTPAPFLEIAFSPVPPEWGDILTAELAGIGFEGFSEEQETLKAYITEENFRETLVHDLISRYPALQGITRSSVTLPARNWNAVWESNYEPVTVSGTCYIRAPFHPPATSGILYEILIEPKMSFGTAHHDTTSLMIGFLLEEPCSDRKVLDMGCGTGILAILAAKRGAGSVVAIDHDEWAVENARENARRNQTTGIRVIQGTSSDIPGEPFDLILANINRNVLMEQIPVYAGALSFPGTLLISGFFREDLPVLQRIAEMQGLRHAETRQSESWISAKFVK